MSTTTELKLGRVEESMPEESFPKEAPPTHKGNGMKRRTKIILAIVGALALVGLVVGGIVWSRRGVVTVQTGKVVKQEISSVVTASGQIRPPTKNLANVNANSYGKITDIYVKEGDTVKKGQLLLRTESVQQEADVDAGQAALKTQLADVSATEAAVQSSAASSRTLQADLQTAHANFNRAKEDFARAQELLKDRLIAQQLYDQRRSEFEVAQANVQAAEARVAQAKAQYQQATYTRDMSHARVAQSRAALVRANDLRAKTIYSSPLDGTVTALPMHVGENVVPGIQNSPGSLLYQVSDLSVITAEVKVDETDIVNVKLGQPAEVTIDAVREKTFKGKVTEIGQSAIGRTTGQTVGQSSTGTATEEAKDFKVVVTLENPPAGLRPGLSTTAKITTATRPEAVTIPIQALAIRMKRDLEEPPKDGKGGGAVKTAAAETKPAAETSKEKEKSKEEIQGVFVVKNGKAVFTKVETGIMGATDMEVLSGVKPGDEIVTGSFSVLRTLKNDTKIKVDNSGSKPGGPAS